MRVPPGKDETGQGGDESTVWRAGSRRRVGCLLRCLGCRTWHDCHTRSGTESVLVVES